MAASGTPEMMSGVRASSMRIEFDLVHDAEVVPALHAVLQANGHVVAQVVEAELGVGAVGDVGGVGRPPLGLGHHRADHADADPQRVVDGLHPFGVAARQVVVDRDQVDAVPGERVEVDGRHGGEGLPLAGLHLGDLAGVERHGSDELDVEQPQTELAAAHLADHREGLLEEVVERLGLVALQARLELVGLRAELRVGELLDLRLEQADAAGLALHRLHCAALADAKDLVEEVSAHEHARGLVWATP